MLREVLTLPRAVGIPLVSRVKIMSGLDIADRLRPQDGRARVLVDGTRVDLRVSTLPAALGEKVVIRVLDTRAAAPSIHSLGFDPVDRERIVGLLDAREGIDPRHRPTGSGKTTTLYAALREVQRRGVNVVTVEDPVEYRMPGVVQVQVHEKAGLTFATRCVHPAPGPDVVLVGEIRDRETATIAVQAALTGHVVLSTLHTIDAPSAIARLMDLGVERYKIAAALRGVVAQRLVRRACTSCGPAAGDARAASFCACGGTGFLGRLAGRRGARGRRARGRRARRRRADAARGGDRARGRDALAVGERPRARRTRRHHDRRAAPGGRAAAARAARRRDAAARVSEPTADGRAGGALARRPPSRSLPDLEAMFDLLPP
jgi:type II secretory ATPase GspE/PulE/Tfp pilus assembly ATPase PilB-like protein